MQGYKNDAGRQRENERRRIEAINRRALERQTWREIFEKVSAEIDLARAEKLGVSVETVKKLHPCLN